MSLFFVTAAAALAVSVSVPPQDLQQPKEPIPPITEADREAAFPPGLDGHTTHETGLRGLVLFDRLEWHPGETPRAELENTTWIGGDIARLWLRVNGALEDGRLEDARLEVLYGRSVSRWWDIVAGVRQDFRPGDPLTWAAVGIQGLAVYFFEVQVTGYVGSGGRTALELEAEHDLLLTNRLILQSTADAALHGKRDEVRGIGTGLSSVEAGLQLRYEVRREFAPYVGVTWERAMGSTARIARENGENVGDARMAVGLRLWW